MNTASLNPSLKRFRFDAEDDHNYLSTIDTNEIVLGHHHHNGSDSDSDSDDDDDSMSSFGSSTSPTNISAAVGSTLTSSNPTKKKRQRLTHLTAEEKLQRRKMKNRVAAQSARDRKKARMEELEASLDKLQRDNERLLKENKMLKNTAKSLLEQNRKLLEGRKSTQTTTTSSPTVDKKMVPTTTTPMLSKSNEVDGSAVDAASFDDDNNDVIVAPPPSLRHAHVVALEPASLHRSQLATVPPTATQQQQQQPSPSPLDFGVGAQVAHAPPATIALFEPAHHFKQQQHTQEWSCGSIGDLKFSDLVSSVDVTTVTATAAVQPTTQQLATPILEKIVIDDLVSMAAVVAAAVEQPIISTMTNIHDEEPVGVELNEFINTIESFVNDFDSTVFETILNQEENCSINNFNLVLS